MAKKKTNTDPIINPQKYIAELFGTLLLTLTVTVSITATDFPIATPIVAAFTLMLCVYSIGKISGCHINPAVTIGLLSRGKISVTDSAAYIISQIAGALIGMYIALMFTGVSPAVQAGANVDWSLFTAEMLGMIIFTFGISSVVDGNVPDSMSGITVGGSLLLGVLVASQVSNGVLNPAVALGIGSLSPMYVAGPIVGSILGFWIYRFVGATAK